MVARAARAWRSPAAASARRSSTTSRDTTRASPTTPAYDNAPFNGNKRDGSLRSRNAQPEPERVQADPLTGVDRGNRMRAIDRRDAARSALAALLLAVGLAAAQSPAVNPTEADRREAAAAAAAGHPAAQQSAGVDGDPLGRAAGRRPFAGRETNVLIQPRRADLARAARADRVCWAGSSSRSRLAGSRSSTCWRGPMGELRQRRASGSSSDSRRWTATRTGCVAISGSRSRSPGSSCRSARRAAAADRLHAVLVARRRSRRTAQLRRAAPHRRRAADCSSASSATTASASRTSSGSPTSSATSRATSIRRAGSTPARSSCSGWCSWSCSTVLIVTG